MPDATQLCDKNAEAGVVSCMLVDGSCVPKVLSEIDPDYISDPKTKTAFNAIYELAKEGNPVDLLTVSSRIKEINKWNHDMAERLNFLSNFVVTSVNLTYYISTVRKYAALRKIQVIMGRMQSSIVDTKSIESVTGSVGEIMDIVMSVDVQKGTSAKSILDETVRIVGDVIDGKKTPNIPYGWSMHDRLLKGLGPGHLVIIGARPAMGKTQYAINIARMLVAKNISTYIKSYEMSSREVMERMINMNSSNGIYFSEEFKKKPGEIDVEAVMSIIEETYLQLADKMLHIDDVAGDDTVRLKSRLKQKKMEGQLDVGIVDYLQLIPKNKHQMQHADPMAQISRELKLTAKEVEIPIIALAQLNRNATQRSNKRPSLEDLRESGAIEQDADVVILLHRDDYYQETSESRGIIEVIIAKNRHGATGIIKMMYDRTLGLMGEIDERDIY